MESTKNSVAMPYESAPPFIIIVGAFCAMAGLQYVGNNIIYGKPKVRTHFELPSSRTRLDSYSPLASLSPLSCATGTHRVGETPNAFLRKRKGHPSLTPLFPPLRSQTNTPRSTLAHGNGGNLPQPMGQDEWDKKLIERDARLIEEAKQSKAKPKYAFTGGEGKRWMGLF